MTLIFVYLICNRDYHSYLIFRLIINSFFESKQVFFSSQYESHLHHHHCRNEKREEIFERNLTESKSIAARIFNVNANSLISFIKRDSDQKNENHNKKLQNHKINAFDNFIRSLLKHSILFTCVIVFNAIVNLKRAHHRSTSSKRWFRDWWKQDHLHKIKTKSLFIMRFEVDHEEAVIEWFLKYKITLKALNVRKRRNIINFDEIDFRSKCMKKQEIIVSIEIRKHYQVNFENRKSLIIIEMINVIEEFFSSLMIIIQKQDLMIN